MQQREARWGNITATSNWLARRGGRREDVSLAGRCEEEGGTVPRFLNWYFFRVFVFFVLSRASWCFVFTTIVSTCSAPGGLTVLLPQTGGCQERIFSWLICCWFVRRARRGIRNENIDLIFSPDENAHRRSRTKRAAPLQFSGVIYFGYPRTST